MKNVSILFPDQVHFHDRNFKSLFDTIKKHSIRHTFVTNMHHLVAAFGDYFEHKEQLINEYNEVSQLSNEELFKLKENGTMLFKVYRSEALSYFLSLPKFRNKISQNFTDYEIFENMSQVNHEALLLNISAAIFWLKFWDDKLKTLKIHTYACIFSGEQIYNRALLEKLKTHTTTPLVLEHFFTGNEFYFEEKYEPIPNNTNLKHMNAYKSIILPSNQDEFERKRIKAINKVLLSKNKNVLQPSEFQKIENDGRKIISIIGQVYNDYSIIGTATKYLSSINFYLELIDKLLDQESNYVVFKAHPWERNKTRQKLAPTYDALLNYREKLPYEKKNRLLITENFNLSDLINQSEHIVTLCSQSAIEAAFLGSKPVQLGNAFYGKKGFTYDYSCIDDFINDLQDEKLSRALTLNEYKNLEIFLMKFLEVELASVHKSGIGTLENKLKLYPYIKLVKQEKPTIISEAKNEIQKLVSSPLESALVQKAIDIVSNNLTKEDISSETLSKKIVKDEGITIEKNKKSNLLRKFRKLTKNPKSFFFDSKSKILNKIGSVMFNS